MIYDLVIIGGGASGLCTAIMSKKEDNSILILERGSRAGKKILSTGNGRCNLSNSFCRAELFDSNPENIPPYFSDTDDSFAKKVIKAFNVEDTIDFFEDTGLLTIDKDGYIYPLSEQASAVLDILRFKCEEAGVEIRCSSFVEKVEYVSGSGNGHRFRIDDILCRNLVIATGGMSVPETGSDGSGYLIAESLGHKIIKPLPALCALKCSDKFTKSLAGVRCRAELELFRLRNKKRILVMKIIGNLQFVSDGISGIPVFQLSIPGTRLLDEKEELLIRADLLPDVSEERLTDFFKFDPEKRLAGALNKKLVPVIKKEAAKSHPDASAEEMAEIYTNVIKKFKLHPVSTYGFQKAQTTYGGVDLREIDPVSMESKKVKGLFFTGEIVDVTGICGGYNLQWAWSSAHAVAKHLTGSGME